jgi:hypothetical protein
LAGRWLTDEVVDLAPKIAFRDADALRRRHPGMPDSDIAEQLIRNASRTTAAVGAAAGGVAAMEFLAPPAMLAAPAQLAAEVLAVTAVELRLVAELHEILGRSVSGSLTDRATAYLMSWMRRRAVTSELAATGVSAMLGDAAKRELRSHVLRRFGRGTTTLAPFLAGAVAGAEINRRSTRSLGEAVAADLTSRRPPQLPADQAVTRLLPPGPLSGWEPPPPPAPR